MSMTPTPKTARRAGTWRAALGTLALASLSLLAAPASAAPPPPVQTQVPGYYRQALGEFEITALYDGYVDLAPQLLKGLRADQVQSLLARMFIANTKGVQTAVNGYLVHTGEHLVLVDAGAAQCFGPTLGQINSNLKAAGYSAEAVDVVLLTHLHPDHLCGLVDGQGKAAFPNATVYAAKADADFWLSTKAADAAPDGFKPFFKMAGDSVAPYQAGGRFKTYTPGETLIPGVEALDTSGHTPGHSSYLFRSKGQQALVWGDIVHSHAVQFAHPEVSIEFDSNQKQAIAARKSLFLKAAQSGWMVAGAHLPFPGLGHVRRDAKGYAWVPVEFGPIRKDR